MSKIIITPIGGGTKLSISGVRSSIATVTEFSHVVNPGNVTTALLLAAGTGTRLHPLTKDAPKCLTEVGGVPILKRLVDNLRSNGFNRLIVVIGYLGNCIKEFLELHAGDMQIDYVTNPDYRTTNNIYSLWLARKRIKEPFLLVESDLIFETGMLGDMLKPDNMAVSRMLPWMNGTTVELDTDKRVTIFRMGNDSGNGAKQYKTVNIYSFSLATWNMVEQRLSRYISQGRLGDYYEAVFAEMVADGTLSFNAIFFDSGGWYEIDTRADLRCAEKLFELPRFVADRSLIVTKSATPHDQD